MPLIIATSDVRNRMGLIEDDGVEKSILSALDAAVVYVEARIKTSLRASAAAVSEVFFLNPDTCVARDGLYTLILQNGFVHSGTVITASESLADALSSSSQPVGTSIVNMEQGRVRIPEDYSGQYVTVSYSYGFEEDDESAPSWLKECILSCTSRALAYQQISDGKPELSNVFDQLEPHIESILLSKARYVAEAISSLR